MAAKTFGVEKVEYSQYSCTSSSGIFYPKVPAHGVFKGHFFQPDEDDWKIDAESPNDRSPCRP